jgi:hypothetical protein
LIPVLYRMQSELHSYQTLSLIKKSRTYLKIELETAKLPIRLREKIRRKFINFYKCYDDKIIPICVTAIPNYKYDINFSDIQVSFQCACNSEGKVKLSCDFERSDSDQNVGTS